MQATAFAHQAMKSAKTVATGALLLLLGACASSFRSDVSTFHDTPPAPGKTFAITPMNPDRKDSIEYAQYAAMLVGELERIGFQPADEGAAPDMVVGFDVVQSEGREKIISRPSAGFNGWWGGGFGYGHWRAFYRPFFYDPFFAGPWGWGGGWGPGWGGGFGGRDLDARTVYPTTLFVEIRELNGDLRFEGRAATDARNRALNYNLPLLARSLFTGFPGPEGGTRRVRLGLDKDGQVTSEKVREVASVSDGRLSRY